MLLGLLREHGASNTHALADLAGHSRRVVLQSLRYLEKAGKVKKVIEGTRGARPIPSTWKAVK
jgi:DeoR/GlpR family transcriptional regulator of sugar metabolism